MQVALSSPTDLDKSNATSQKRQKKHNNSFKLTSQQKQVQNQQQIKHSINLHNQGDKSSINKLV